MITDYLLREIGYSAKDLPHAFYALAGAASLIFAVAPECRQLTGIDPMKKAAVERHAEFRRTAHRSVTHDCQTLSAKRGMTHEDC